MENMGTNEINPNDWYTREEVAVYVGKPLDFIGTLLATGDMKTYRGTHPELSGRVRGRDITALQHQLRISRPRTEVLSSFEDRVAVTRLLNSGDFNIYGFKLGRQWYIPQWEIEEFEDDFQAAYNRELSKQE